MGVKMNYNGLNLSKAIKEGKWLNLKYINKNHEKSSFWCSIIGINIEARTLEVKMYNKFKNNDFSKDPWIFFDQIESAEVIEGTTYEVPLGLIEKIEKNSEKLKWLFFDDFNDAILNYFKECFRFDNDPQQRKYDLVDGIDVDRLTKKKWVKLNARQFGQIVDNIYEMELNDFERFKFQQLAINVLSISIGKQLYVVAYKSVLLNVMEQTLVISKEIQINKSFLIDGKKVSLGKYLEMEANEFVSNFPKHVNKYKELLQERIPPSETLNEMPFLMVMERNAAVDLGPTYQAISEAQKENKLSVPLKAFFGNMSVRNLRKKESNICFKNNKFNIDQLRVVFNSMKNPITYVQGPPGTGKTATIANIVLTAFINEKSALITSNNNKPVDDIYKKIKFSYKKDEVPFPILRLGKQEENLEAMSKIKGLYTRSQSITIMEELLMNIGNESVKHFDELNLLLKKYERRLEIEEQKEILQSLLATQANSEVRSSIISELEKYNKENEEIGIIDDEDVMKFTFIAEDDFRFMEYIYYKSFQNIKRLGEPKYKTLLEILEMDDKSEEDKKTKNTEFIKFLNEENNMDSFIKVFPYILTTNISSNKLGSPKEHFDLCIIDEAGQCNVSTSLLPIVRCKDLVLIGDQNQLQPVIVLEENINKRLMEKYHIDESYNYCNNSIIKTMQAKDKISRFILLRYHYRCQKKIIQFSNARFYDDKLRIKTVPSEIPDQLEFYQVKSEKFQGERNSSYQEALTIVEIIKKNKYKDVGIITPFRNQAEQIKKLLRENNIFDVDAGTIHTFQGDEKSVIIMSTAILKATSEKTYRWAEENKEMINVAVTRAKDKLIVVGDYDEIKKKSKGKDDNLFSLAEYVKTNGTSVVVPVRSSESFGLKSYDTKAESDFFKTISHITTTVKNIEFKSKVKISTAFENVFVRDKEFYFKGEFDFVVYDKSTKLPILVIEVDGNEHILNEVSIANDRKKERICKDNKIRIIRIPNHYVKRYELIKEWLVKTLGNEHLLQKD